MANEITYNGRTIATFEEGQTATLVCAGKMAVSNIVVVFESVGRIIYNNMTTEVDAGKTATLFCAGKKMLTDVVVETGMLAKGVRLVTSDGYTITDTNGLYVTTKGE